MCYAELPIIGGLIAITIPEPIMITILSTTTVNIIGLGLIVLRGHFLANDKSNNMDEDKSNKIEGSQFGLPFSFYPSTMSILTTSSSIIRMRFIIRLLSGFTG